MDTAQTAHFKGEGGVVWEMTLPLPETMQEKVTKGYLRRVNPDGTPYVEPADVPDPVAPAAVTERPAQSAPKAEWVGWAVHNGMAPDDADGLTKQDLIDRYGRD